MSAELRLYRPSNGSEGDCFHAEYCDRCEHDRAFREGTDPAGCEIHCRALFLDTKHEDYPREWCYDAADNPVCTAFKEQDDNEGDAPKPEPPDPAQLVLIADPTEDAALFPAEPPAPALVEVPA